MSVKLNFPQQYSINSLYVARCQEVSAKIQHHTDEAIHFKFLIDFILFGTYISYCTNFETTPLE